MFKQIKKLFQLLNSRQRKQFLRLQLLLVIMASFELVGIGSIAPFMALVGDMSILEKENIIASLYLASGLDSESQFVFILGILVLLALILSASISMVTTWRMSMFATRIGTEIADRLFAYYLRQDWSFHTESSSTQHMRKIANETARITGSVLLPLVYIYARAFTVIFVCMAIFIFDPKVAIIGIIIFALAYITLYRFVRGKLYRNGVMISNMYENRFRLMGIGFGGIKDLLLLGRSESLISQFKEAGDSLAISQGKNYALAQIPRYLIELVAFGAMIALVLYLIAVHNSNLGVILPIISVYALASFKLLPALQFIYVSLADVKGALPALEAVIVDLEGSINEIHVSGKNEQNIKEEFNLHPKKYIRLENVSFSYPGNKVPVLENLDLTIKANMVAGIVGSSASGKTTTIDIIMGLLKPQQGRLIIDDIEICAKNLRNWQNSIGFVPQAIFLAEGNIAENVAFGIPPYSIDYEQVQKALELAHLDEMIRDLPNGIYSMVGERGVRLSGGQRQRIAIARALYHEADVLVFDEATSAMDGITEKMIMEAIHDFSGEKTIIMIAHRLKTIEQCDMIFVMDNGSVIDQGDYQSLMETSALFREMALHN
jgi:HlyD family secretion protein